MNRSRPKRACLLALAATIPFFAVLLFPSGAHMEAIADMPERYNVEVIPDRPFLVIPEVSSERRSYVPIGWLEPPVIPSSLVRVLLDADLWHFGVPHFAYAHGMASSDWRTIEERLPVLDRNC